MRYLIDGNNLEHAVAAAGGDFNRMAICRRLEALAAGGQAVRIIFDGAAPGEPAAGFFARMAIHVEFSARRTADELLIERIAADTSPRRLAVVSTDGQVRRAARRRRCKLLRSENFARELSRPEPSGPIEPAEPSEKRQGLGPGQTGKWLREFGLDGENDDAATQ